MANSLNAIEPSGGTVTLRGIVVEIDGAVGQAFVLDVCRLLEDLLSVEALRTKYGLLDEEIWQALETNEKLQLAIAAAKERRIHDGSAAREKAAHLFLAAPDVLSAIMTDATASPRHRVDACRELRATAQVGSEANTPASEKERFTITLNFGKGHTINKTVDLKPIAPERDEENKPMKLIERDEEDDDYEPPEYEPI
jgi:hypothetical protein